MNVGVIGLGVGEQHLRAYQSLENCNVVAVCDIDMDRLNSVADRYKVPERHTDYRAITEADDVNIVSICSYDDVHARQAISALEHGKHVMIEKPIALLRSDAEELATAYERSDSVLTSNLILRATPRFQEIRRAVQAGELGEIFYMEGDYIHQILHKIVTGWRGRMDFYCVLYGGGIHLIDLMRWILGDEVTEVTGMSNKILTRDTDFRYDDTTINLLRFDGGAIAKTLTTFGPQRPKFHALDIYGTKAAFTNGTPDGTIYRGDDPAAAETVSSPYPGTKKGDLIPAFIDAIRSGQEPTVTARDVFRVMDICFAAMESLTSGKTVRVSYLM